ncbi:MAG TPA: AbrB/MazE/SpoVT family DNA-binding domain-containing protein [Candidatus Paceibacterota bacterium]|nr:AbrB/MazE/SpoVT family DNA-binding domain-containing protein [Candidatus Paceibacterota bacterium]
MTFIRKLTRSGGGRSLSVIIPAEIVKELKLREHQKLAIHRRGAEIIIRDWRG